MAENGLAECCPEVPLSPGKKPLGICWTEVSESEPQIPTPFGRTQLSGHLRKSSWKPSVAHACNPCTGEAETR